jgi:hypothetical protein
MILLETERLRPDSNGKVTVQQDSEVIFPADIWKFNPPATQGR